MAKANKLMVKKTPTNGANGGTVKGELEAEQDEEQDAAELAPVPVTTQPEPAAVAAAAPQMKILGQYLKDLSFENPTCATIAQHSGGAAGDQHLGQCECADTLPHGLRGRVAPRSQGLA